MIIQQYDAYKLEIDKLSVDIVILKKVEKLFYLRQFFLWDFKRINDGLINFIKDIVENPQDKFIFEDLEILFDPQDDLIYFIESWYDYHTKPMTKEIEELYDKDEYVQLCKIGFFDYMTIDKNNFFQLLLSWDKILDDKPCFVVLYQDENDWYDVIPFFTKQEMENFVSDHLQN
ncbi:MAG: hypothetical protein ACXWL5_05000 [Candidatus Chromulinivorax sp.]